MDCNSLDDSLPLKLYRADQVRELDRLAIQQYGIAGFTLMRRAGQATFDVLLAHYPQLPQQTLTIFCGTGNNGGDGYVMASLAVKHGIAVEVIQVGSGEKLTGDALQAKKRADQDGVVSIPFAAELNIKDGVIIDALLGVGLSGDVRGEFAQAITLINAYAQPVVAVDIPSGICSDSGQVLGNAIVAEHTVTFIGIKQGLLSGSAPDYTGVIHYSDLAVPAEAFDTVAYAADRLSLQGKGQLLKPRSRIAHKGHFGHVMVVGGDAGMAGAAAMASQAALRVGAGLVSCATRPAHIAALVSRCPEVMVHGVISGQEIEPILAGASVIVVGPGLGLHPWGEQLLQQVCQRDVPLVVDADALNILADGRVVKHSKRDNWILTPHPGEAARLIGCSTAEIQQNRFAAVAELQRRFGGVVILKGAGTLVADNIASHMGVCHFGNPGMATGGMGDVLSGVLGALLAQGLSPSEAARLGVCIHAQAADMAAKAGERGMAATDLIPFLRQVVN